MPLGELPECRRPQAEQLEVSDPESVYWQVQCVHCVQEREGLWWEKPSQVDKTENLQRLLGRKENFIPSEIISYPR